MSENINPNDFTPAERDAIIKAILNLQNPPDWEEEDPQVTPELFDTLDQALVKLGVKAELRSDERRPAKE